LMPHLLIPEIRSMELTLIQQKIYEVRGLKVMLDFDLAELFEVETRKLKQNVRRNMDRFPEDFMIALKASEWKDLRSQFVILENKSKYNPFAFTEHGVTMLASVLRSERAVLMNIAIVRAFIAMRAMAMHYKELAAKIIAMEEKYDGQSTEVFDALRYLMAEKNSEIDWASRERIGFKTP